LQKIRVYEPPGTKPEVSGAAETVTEPVRPTDCCTYPMMPQKATITKSAIIPQIMRVLPDSFAASSLAFAMYLTKPQKKTRTASDNMSGISIAMIELIIVRLSSIVAEAIIGPISIAPMMNFFINKIVDKELIIDRNDLLYHPLMINYFTTLSNNNYKKGVDMFHPQNKMSHIPA
jgi:hypothetical protein